MPVRVPMLREGAALRPAGVPARLRLLHAHGSEYVCWTDDDLFADDIPPELGRRVLERPVDVDPRFAGLHYHRQPPPLRHGTVRTVDHIGCRWSEIEPAPGVQLWAALDALVGTAAAAGRDVVWCPLDTPTWASARPGERGHYGPGGNAEPLDPAELERVVRTMCLRYASLGTPIRAVEVWNEPKYGDGGGVPEGNYFSGTPQALARMARGVHRGARAGDPRVVVLSPSPTGLEYPWVEGDRSGTDNLHRFLAADDGAGATGGRWIDAVAIHTYSHTGANDVGAIPTMLANARTATRRAGIGELPIWVTETSAIDPPLVRHVADWQQAYVARNLVLSLAAGAARVVWYAWDGPLGFDQQPAVAAAWDRLVTLLAGARIEAANRLVGGEVAAVIGGVRHLF